MAEVHSVGISFTIIFSVPVFNLHAVLFGVRLQKKEVLLSLENLVVPCVGRPTHDTHLHEVSKSERSALPHRTTFFIYYCHLLLPIQC